MVVALYMSAWIEILGVEFPSNIEAVALYMSAWIEIISAFSNFIACWSHSTWVHGLKSD